MRLPTPVLLCATLAAAGACENPFGYSYLAETLKPGKYEFEQFVTGLFAQDLGPGHDPRYRWFDLRPDTLLGFPATQPQAPDSGHHHYSTHPRARPPIRRLGVGVVLRDVGLGIDDGRGLRRVVGDHVRGVREAGEVVRLDLHGRGLRVGDGGGKGGRTWVQGPTTAGNPARVRSG